MGNSVFTFYDVDKPKKIIVLIAFLFPRLSLNLKRDYRYRKVQTSAMFGCAFGFKTVHIYALKIAFIAQKYTQKTATNTLVF
jgi:hypothetical protein